MAVFATAKKAQRVLLGLIGSPIAHSASPAMHEAAARAAGFEAHYHLIEVAGAGRTDLAVMLEGICRLGFAGANVTFPYKEAVVPLLNRLSPEAEAIGAVNTVVVEDGELVGHNTDASGFAAAYRNLKRRDGDRPVAIIGAGGVGRAIAFALISCGVTRLRLFDLDRDKTAALARLLERRADVEISGSVAAAVEGAAGIVNATPLGMLPNRDTPVPPTLIEAAQWVADAVYHPLWTPLLLAAQKADATVMTGRELAIHQALDAFRLFTGAEPSETAMSETFDRVMAERAEAERAA
ncbi:shikimate dehydrogenase [Bosea caraganae]|uniref:Shikimate dehydrogenase (NADP(+)) n=1 Tax=Bosea caraganae TaxID=2763117 RepID=A0A370L6B4_9HYPH|nr:shikimate dehydrogenase [Bosea caraganae]RDJ23209.1 shikimate dehydrogenase [Bosea caraganae]RDJ24677.1 shikimate dehydrogenase [Bosea caraganae]